MRTVFPQKKFLSTNPDYVFGSNTAGHFIPPYTGYYYMRAVGGGGSGSLRSDTNECVGGGAGGGYDGEIFLEGGVAIPYSVGTGGAAVTLGNWGNNGTDTFFGDIVLGGGYGGNIGANGGRGGSAGMYKGGLTYFYKIDPVYSTFLGHIRENPESDGVLFGGGGGMTFFYTDAASHFDFLANGCGKNVRNKAYIDGNNSAPSHYRFSGCSVFGAPVSSIGRFAHGSGGDVYKGGDVAYNSGHGRIEIWRLQ